MIWGKEITNNFKSGFYKAEITKFFKGGSYIYILIVLLVIVGLYFLFSRFPILLWILIILSVLGAMLEPLIKRFKK